MLRRTRSRLGLSVEGSRQGINPLAELALREFGIVGRIARRPCGIDAALTDILGRRPFSRAWRPVFGGNYDRAVRIAVAAKAYAQTDATAFVNTMDTFHDVLLDCVFRHDGSIGQYKLGNIGSILHVGSRFARGYPQLFDAVKDLHETRLQSDLSHAYVRRTGRPTGRIRFSYLSKIKPKLLAAYAELDAAW